jgi:mono/diheme cytochrome c family protein
MLNRGVVAEAGDLSVGARLFQTLCASCHGQDGTGTAKSNRIDFTKPEWQEKMTDAAIARSIRRGKMPAMPPFSVKKDELEGLMKYVRSLRATTASKGGY